jgi:hypothetical protein
MSWYTSGFEGIEKEQQRLDSMQGPGRLWIPVGAQKDIVFVDDDPPGIYEHNPKMNGNYRNQLTCLLGAADDVACCQVLGPNSRYYVGYLTCVDCSSWRDKKGNEHQYEMRLFPAKMGTMKKLRRKKEEKGSLVGAMYRCARDNADSASVGDEMEFQRVADLHKLFQVANYRGKKLHELWSEAEANVEVMARVQRTFNVKPVEGKLPRIVPTFNYFEVLKPRPPQELRLLLGQVEPDDGKEDGAPGTGATGATGKQQDATPF